MAKTYDVKIGFELPECKLLFNELFVKKINKPLKIKFHVCSLKKENNYKDLVYSSRWISITYFESYFNNKFWKRNHIEFSHFIFKFFEYLSVNLSLLNKDRFLLKIIFIANDGTKFYFLFAEIYSINFLKNAFSEIIKKIQNYRAKDIATIKETKNAFKLRSKKIYYELENKNWVQINLLFNAGKYHHDDIAKNIHDTRIGKPDIVVNKEYLNHTIKYKPLRMLEIDKGTIVRVKPNDIALYSSIAIKNLKEAKKIYDDKNSVLWKFIQLKEDEQKLMDYYELVITAIILAFSAIEALINIAIPAYYLHKRKEKNNKSGRFITKKYSKNEIERWYNMDDKMNVVLPDALHIPMPNQQKWWVRFDKLEKIRNKIVHAIESKSDERYSELLKIEIFVIVESHIEVIRFFGKWATDNKHYLLNELPYGFSFDDIMPILISKKDYIQVQKERRGIK